MAQLEKRVPDTCTWILQPPAVIPHVAVSAGSGRSEAEVKQESLWHLKD